MHLTKVCQFLSFYLRIVGFILLSALKLPQIRCFQEIFGFKDYLIIAVLYLSHTKKHKRLTAKGVITMTKTQFSKKIADKTGLSTLQSALVAELLEGHNIFSKDERPLITEEISLALGCDAAQAESIFADTMSIVSSQIKKESVMWLTGIAAAVIAGIVVFKHKKTAAAKES